MLIGERLNAQGSKKMKELLLAEDYDGIVALGREQIDGGAHTLDICVAMTERRDETYLMSQVVRKLSQTVEAPLVIDTTEAEVLEAALEAAPGRVIVNAVNMENGRQRLDAMLPLVRDYGAATIALTIDEHGMARTADRKVEVAQEDPRHRDARVRPAARRADLRRPHLHAGHRRCRERQHGGRDARRHPADQGGAAGRPDVARRVQRLLRLQAGRAVGAELACSSTTPFRPASTWRSSTRSRSRPTPTSRPPSATWPRTCCSTAGRTPPARFIAFFEGAKQRQAAAVRSDRRHVARRAAALADSPSPAGRAAKRTSTRSSPRASARSPASPTSRCSRATPTRTPTPRRWPRAS